jgi:3-hydroxyacyl-CoA dehydrogenase / enoyl-CoA hydratase / 3-hydroxybutyryl-CoA epimerase
MKTIQYNFEDGIATITFDEPESPVNTMCAQWQHDLTEVTALVVADKTAAGAAFKGIILASNKSTFFAGADLKGTMALQASDAPRVYAEIQQVKRNFRTLETLGVPVVSCINGSALGGGWEVALVGHYRVAVDSPKILLGLPETTLGLIPGATGITKMTRLLGLMAAQPYILESKLFNPTEGVSLGLIHELVSTPATLRERALAFIAAHPHSQQPWDAKAYKMPGGSPSHPSIAGALSVAPAMLKAKTRGLYPAPEYALCAMVEGAQVDFDTALRIETRYLARLIVSPVAKNMISAFFFDMNAVRGNLPALKDPSHPYVLRLQAAYQTACETILKEGSSPQAIRSAAYQAGMGATPALSGLSSHAANKADDMAQIDVDLAPLKSRILKAIATEAALGLKDGLVANAAQGNIASILGAGFPAWTGGALRYATTAMT